MLTTYGTHKPTQFDSPGSAMLPERADWLIMPLQQNRDSGPLENSNFATALEMLGGESETVEVHRFGHWGPGWYEIIIVEPADTARVAVAEAIASSLEDYPVLDEMDLSNREFEAYTNTWYRGYGCGEFTQELIRKFGLRSRPHVESLIEDADQDKAMEFFESLIPSGDFHDETGCPRIRYAVQACSEADLIGFIKVLREKETV